MVVTVGYNSISSPKVKALACADSEKLVCGQCFSATLRNRLRTRRRATIGPRKYIHVLQHSLDLRVLIGFEAQFRWNDRRILAFGEVEGVARR